MYYIDKKSNDGILSIILKNEISGESAEIIPSLGGNVNRLLLEKEGKLFSILKIKDKHADFEGHNIFNGAKLFPFPNRINQGKYVFEDIEYQLNKNYHEENNACHGFIYDKKFEVLMQDVDEKHAEIKLGYEYNGESQGYPFRFKIELTYRLENKSGFICTTKVINKDAKSLPLGDGWHPFIQINKCVKDLKLKFHSEKIFKVNDNLIPTGETEFYDEFFNGKKIKDATFDDCFMLKKNGNKHFSEIYSESENIKVLLWQETGVNKYNYLQLYIPPERDCIAIEPMTCAPNCFNHKEGLIILNSGEVFEASFGIKIE